MGSSDYGESAEVCQALPSLKIKKEIKNNTFLGENAFLDTVFCRVIDCGFKRYILRSGAFF